MSKILQPSHYRAFLFPQARVEENRVVLDARESHHLVRVLRAQKGAAVDVLDGRGSILRSALLFADAKAAVLKIQSREKITLVGAAYYLDAGGNERESNGAHFEDGNRDWRQPYTASFYPSRRSFF